MVPPQYATRCIPGRESGAVLGCSAVRTSSQIRWVLIRGLVDVRGPGNANKGEHYDRGCKAPSGIVVGRDVSVYVLVHRVLVVGQMRGEKE